MSRWSLRAGEDVVCAIKNSLLLLTGSLLRSVFFWARRDKPPGRWRASEAQGSERHGRPRWA